MKFKSLFVLVLMQFSLVVQACAELGTWSIPSIIRSGAIESDSQHIDVDPHGNAVAVWTEFFNGHYVVMAATKPFDGGWSPPVVLSAQDNTTVNSTVAVDPNGNAVAVWMGGDSNYVFTVQSASLPAGGVWTSPTTVSSPTSTYDVLDIDVDGAGNFIAVWVQHDDSSEPKMQAAKLPFGGSWTMPVDLTPASNSLFYPTVAVNGAGNAIAAWFRLDNQTGLGIIEAATSISGDSWTVATPVSFFDIPFGFQIIPAAAIDPNGNALVLWIDYNGSNNIVRSASLPFGGIWSVPTQLSEEGADGGDPDVAFNLAGYAVAVWTSSNNGGKNVVQSSNLSFGNSWSEPRMISPNVNDARNPLVSMDPKGNCISIWGDGEDNLQAATQTNQGHWCGGMNIANPFEYHNSCSLAMDNYGNGIAVWRISDASTLVSSSYKVNRIQPPTMVEGKQSHKGVRESGQLVNVIRWKSPLFTKPVAYRIYRDNALTQLLGTISADEHPLRFKEQNCPKGITLTYYIVSVDEYDQISQSVFLAVQPIDPPPPDN